MSKPLTKAEEREFKRLIENRNPRARIPRGFGFYSPRFQMSWLRSHQKKREEVVRKEPAYILRYTADDNSKERANLYNLSVKITACTLGIAVEAVLESLVEVGLSKARAAAAVHAMVTTAARHVKAPKKKKENRQ